MTDRQENKGLLTEIENIIDGYAFNIHTWPRDKTALPEARKLILSRVIEVVDGAGLSKERMMDIACEYQKEILETGEIGNLCEAIAQAMKQAIKDKLSLKANL